MTIAQCSGLRVPVTAVSDINNGDILVYKDGRGVTGGDGYTGITGCGNEQQVGGLST